MPDDDRLGDSDKLRKRAEEMVRKKAAESPEGGEGLSSEEAARMLHELRVHQVELEMQNEELRRTNVELDTARVRYLNFYDLAPLGCCTVSDRGVILDANLTAAEFLGVPRSHLFNRPWSGFVFSDDQEIHSRHFKQLLETRRPLAWELRLLRKYSPPFWARIDAVTAQDDSGATICRAVLSDISERKFEEQRKAQLEGENRQLELRQRQAERLARQRLECVGMLASGIAHDINNLLAVVLAQSDLALAEMATGALPVAELNQIRAAAVRGSEIGRQLMIYAGDESEALVMADVSQTIEDMLELLKVSVSKHVVLETNLAKNLPAVPANPAQLRRVVMNLITNASEAIGDADGVIRLSTSQVTVGPDWPRMPSERWADGSYLQIEVADTGRGMAPETQARVFDSLYTTKSVGHGLGLAVVHEIVRGLRGVIRLESALGQGSKFQIFLPCANQSDQESHDIISPAVEEVPRLPLGTILIVEDEQFLRRPLCKMIRQVGYSVLEAGNGYAALDQIRERHNRIDLMLLDITLPGASSREVMEEASRTRPGMKVIVTSAYTAAAASESLGRDVGTFIRKPYRLNDLIALISELCHQPQS
jgi:PAS domain S-box-containing protein